MGHRKVKKRKVALHLVYANAGDNLVQYTVSTAIGKFLLTPEVCAFQNNVQKALESATIIDFPHVLLLMLKHNSYPSEFKIFNYPWL